MVFLILITAACTSGFALYYFLIPGVSDGRISQIVIGVGSSVGQSAKREPRDSKRLLRLYTFIKGKNKESSEKIITLLLRAGVRGPNAVEAFRVSRLIFSLGCGSVSLFFLVLSEKDLAIFSQTAIILVAGVVGFFIPMVLMINKAQKRREEIKAGLPDMLDLMVICLQGGLGLEPSLTRVSNEIRHSHRVLSEELMALNVELSYLGDRFRAYQNLQERVDLPEVRSLVSMMYQSERLGTPLGVAFNTLAAETRTERMSFVEKKAGALSSKLTVPMIVFFVPAMFVVIMGPPILQLLGR